MRRVVPSAYRLPLLRTLRSPRPLRSPTWLVAVAQQDRSSSHHPVASLLIRSPLRRQDLLQAAIHSPSPMRRVVPSAYRLPLLRTLRSPRPLRSPTWLVAVAQQDRSSSHHPVASLLIRSPLRRQDLLQAAIHSPSPMRRVVPSAYRLPLLRTLRSPRPLRSPTWLVAVAQQDRSSSHHPVASLLIRSPLRRQDLLQAAIHSPSPMRRVVPSAYRLPLLRTLRSPRPLRSPTWLVAVAQQDRSSSHHPVASLLIRSPLRRQDLLQAAIHSPSPMRRVVPSAYRLPLLRTLRSPRPLRSPTWLVAVAQQDRSSSHHPVASLLIRSPLRRQDLLQAAIHSPSPMRRVVPSAYRLPLLRTLRSPRPLRSPTWLVAVAQQDRSSSHHPVASLLIRSPLRRQDLLQAAIHSPSPMRRVVPSAYRLPLLRRSDHRDHCDHQRGL